MLFSKIKNPYLKKIAAKKGLHTEKEFYQILEKKQETGREKTKSLTKDYLLKLKI